MSKVKTEFEKVMEKTGLSGKALGKALDVPFNRICQIRTEKRGITADTAVRLAAYLKNYKKWNSALFWLDLQAQDDIQKVESYIDLDAIEPL